MSELPPDNEDRNNILIRTLDCLVVGLVKALIVLRHLRSRDPREHPAYLLKANPRERVHIRGLQAILEWSPHKRVGCFAGVLVGLSIGGAILWYGLK